MISKSNVKFTDSEVRMASRFASLTQQEIEKLLEDKETEMHLTFLHFIVLYIRLKFVYHSVLKCFKIK